MKHEHFLSFHSISLPFFASSSIFALIAFAIFATFESGLEAFAVLFQAKWLLTIAAFEVFVVIDFLTERVRVSVHEDHNSVTSLFCVLFQIMATNTVTTFACLIDSETVAVELEAFGLFAIAINFFRQCVRFWNRKRLRMFLAIWWSFRKMTLRLSKWFWICLRFFGVLLRLELLGWWLLLIWVLFRDYWALFWVAEFNFLRTHVFVALVRCSVPLYLIRNRAQIIVEYLIVTISI